MQKPPHLQEFLSNQPHDKKFLVVSFFVTNPETLRKMKAQWALRDEKHSKVLGRNKHLVESLDYSQFGGSVVLIDPSRLEQGWFAEIDVPHAFGLSFSDKDEALYVTGESEISKIQKGRIGRVIKHRLFSDLHSLTLTKSNNLLVTSTGIDAILEIDQNSSDALVWDWLATEHGYGVTSSGNSRVIDRTVDYSVVPTTTPEHTTHINTAIQISADKLLATLFHQGQVVEIDRKTKKSRILLDGLKSPHHIRKRNRGYVVSDSRANRVLLLDESFVIEKQITADFDWVQDALEFTEGLYLVADSNNDRLVMLGFDGNIISEYRWLNSSRKVSTMEILTRSQVEVIFA